MYSRCLSFLSRSTDKNSGTILYPENQSYFYLLCIYIKACNSLAFYFNICRIGIVTILGAADQLILIPLGRRNIETAVKIKLDFIARESALRQIVFLTGEVKSKVLTRELLKTAQIHPKHCLLIFSCKRTIQTTGVDMSAVYFPKLVLP